MLERYGLAAAIMVALIIASGYAIRHLYKKNQELQFALQAKIEEHAKLIENIRAEEAGRRSGMRDALNRESLDLREQFQSRLDEILKQWQEETRAFAERIEAIQEKRVNEAQEVTRTVVQHVEHTRQAVDKMATVMDTLRSAIQRRD